MDDAGSLPPPPLSELARRTGWIWPLLRVGVVFAAGFVAWIVAENWNCWTGALRYVRTDDANVAGDLTPLSAKVQGYVSKVSVTDYQAVRAGELLVEIDPSDYQAQLAQSDAKFRSSPRQPGRHRQPERRPAGAPAAGRGNDPSDCG